jgi:hypothetical protein
MVRGKLDDPNTEADESTKDQYYRANADGTPDKSQPIDIKDISNDNWPWFKINFSKEAIDEFKVGWIRDEDKDVDKDGADDYNAAIWTQNKQGWMRIDVLWSKATAASYEARQAAQEELGDLEASRLGNYYRGEIDRGGGPIFGHSAQYDYSGGKNGQIRLYDAKIDNDPKKSRWVEYAKWFIGEENEKYTSKQFRKDMYEYGIERLERKPAALPSTQNNALGYIIKNMAVNKAKNPESTAAIAARKAWIEINVTSTIEFTEGTNRF